MAYCSVSDVYNLGVHGSTTFTVNTTPTLAQVNSTIDRVYRLINSELYASGVNIPVIELDSPIAYALLKDLNAIGAGYYAEVVAFNEGSNEPTDSYTPSFFGKDFDKVLKKYCKYPIYLEDANLASSHINKIEREDTFTSSKITDIYDFSHVDNQKAKFLKPFFRSDDKW